MANFPQSFEPVNSDSILEQFLQLKGNVNRVNEAMVEVEETADSAFEKANDNEASIQVLESDVQTLSTGLETAEQNLSKCVRFDAQSLTDAEKAQARTNIGAGSAMATTVLVNGVAQTQIEFDSDPQTQIDSLDSRVETAEDDIITNAGAISALDGKALKTPMSAPAENEIPTINTANAQVNVTVGNGLKIESNELKIDKNSIIDFIFPIGSYFITESSNFDTVAKVQTHFGGTWTQITDTFLYGSTTAGATGGEATHTLTVAEMPSHSHELLSPPAQYVGDWVSGFENNGYTPRQTSGSYYQPSTKTRGDGQPHNNMPPYRTVYMYRRES